MANTGISCLADGQSRADSCLASAAGMVSNAKICSGVRKSLDGYLGQYVHAPDFGGDSEPGARARLDSQNSGMAANPAFFAGSEFGRQNENEVNLGTGNHCGFGVEKNAVGADVASLGIQFGISGNVADPHREASGDAFTGTAIDSGVQYSWPALPGTFLDGKFGSSQARWPV